MLNLTSCESGQPQASSIIQQPPTQAVNYPYTKQLLALASCTNSKTLHLPIACTHIVTPLIHPSGQQGLAGHPVKKFVQFILEGILRGFHIGFNYQHHRCKHWSQNMVSALQNPHVVQDLNIAKRVVQIPNSCRPEIQTNRFGVIPKPNQTGKWRLIVDLFHPMEYSVNDGIDSDYCSMRYATASGTSCSKTS